MFQVYFPSPKHLLLQNHRLHFYEKLFYCGQRTHSLDFLSVPLHVEKSPLKLKYHIENILVHAFSYNSIHQAAKVPTVSSSSDLPTNL